MASRAINLNASSGNASVTSINCGTSVPALGGTVSLFQFPNLTSFKCNNNEITALGGVSGLNQLTTLEYGGNRITGTIAPLPPNLVNFNCSNNPSSSPAEPRTMTGSLPALPSSLQRFFCTNHNITGAIPTLPVGILTFHVNLNNLTGAIPNLSSCTQLVNFRCERNQLSGTIPSLPASISSFDCSTNTAINGTLPNLSTCTSLTRFACMATGVSGDIPDLSRNTSLEFFYASSTQLSGFAAGGGVPRSLGTFEASGCRLTKSAIDAILAAFVAANKTTGTRVLNLAGVGNSSPTGGVNNTDRATLVSRGWTVSVNP